MDVRKFAEQCQEISSKKFDGKRQSNPPVISPGGMRSGMMEAPVDIPKVVALFDIDCFFCQVESKRDPSLKGKPFVVHQHEDIISISYEGISPAMHL